MSEQFNNHHGEYPKNAWRMMQFARRIREHPGMIIHGIYVPTHNGIHREVPPIMPPTKSLAILMLSNIHSLNVNDGREGIPLQADFLWRLTEQENGRIGEEAYKYAEHLQMQIDYLGLGKEAA